MSTKEPWQEIAERRQRHIEIRDQQLRNAGERIARLEIMLGSEWNLPTLRQVLEAKDGETLLDAAREMRRELDAFRGGR